MINSHKFVTSNGELMYIHALIDGSSLAPVVDGCEVERDTSGVRIGKWNDLASRVV